MSGLMISLLQGSQKLESSPYTWNNISADMNINIVSLNRSIKPEPHDPTADRAHARRPDAQSVAATMTPGAVDNTAPDPSSDPKPPASPPPAAAASTRNMNGPPAGIASLAARLAERVERARDAIVDTEIYSTLAEVSSAVGERTGKAWEFSKQASWIVGTSALVLIVPLLYEMDKEISANDAAAAADAATPAVGDSAAVDAGAAAADAAAPAA